MKMTAATSLSSCYFVWMKIVLLWGSLLVVILPTRSAAWVTTSTSTALRRHSQQPPTIISTTRTATTLFSTPANNNKKKNKSNSKPISSSSGGTGFGKASSATTTPNKNAPATAASAAAVPQMKGRRVAGTGTTTVIGTEVLRQAANTFDALRKKYGKECSYDVYVRSPRDDNPLRYWFVGKVALDIQAVEAALGNNNNTTIENSDASSTSSWPGIAPIYACLAQKRVILEYSQIHLRPQNLGGPLKAPALELWYAPADSEMDVVQNKVNLMPVKGSAAKDLPTAVDWQQSSGIVGYNPEIYVGEEIAQGGLRVIRDEHGCPIRPVFDVKEAV